MKATSSRQTSVEVRALARARAALAARRLEDAAGCYLQAARVRERAGEDPFPHYHQALDLFSAAGRSVRGIALARRLLRRRDHRARSERPLLRLRLAQLLGERSRHREAAREYRLAIDAMPRGDARGLQAGIGLAGSYLRLGDLQPLPGLLEGLVRRARRLEDRRSEVSAIFLQGLLGHWSADWAGGLRGYDRARQLAGDRGMLSLEFSSCVGLAEVYARLGMRQDARNFAARAHEITRRLEDAEVSATGSLVHAAALVEQALDLEKSETPGFAVGLRREARRLLAGARKHFSRTGNETRLTECWLQEQRLALRSTSRTSSRAAAAATRHAHAAGLWNHALLARALELQGQRKSAPPSAWRKLARKAESAGAEEIAAAAWSASVQLDGSDSEEAQSAASSAAALDRGFQCWARARPGMAALPVEGWLDAARVAVTRGQAEYWLTREPEPKAVSLEWSLAAAATAAAPPLGAGGAGVEPESEETARRYSVLEAAHLDAARRSGHGRRSRAERALLERARSAFLRSVEPASGVPPALPEIPGPEALVVLARVQEEVHAWVVRSSQEIVAHHCLGDVSAWRSGAAMLDRQFQDARGWPDSIIPETLIRASHSALREIGTMIWTPLWPALAGVARVLLVPDSTLPLLPFTALILAAQPSQWPRPRALCLVPNPGLRRTRRWRTPSGRAFAVAGRDPLLPVYQREAQGVTRVIGGEVTATSALRIGEDGNRAELSRSLRKARLFHVAAPVHTLADHPGFSYVDLGEEPLPMWWLVRDSRTLRLIVLSSCAPEGPTAPVLGRVVGVIGPEGMTRYDAPPARAKPRTDIYDLSRYLLDSGIERVVLNSNRGNETGATVVTSTFYAGIARGDDPASALFLAQRNAWSEEIHPILWSGYSCWGWP